MRRLALCVLLWAAVGWAAPKRVLYVTATAGFRHDSITTSWRVLTDIAARSGGLLDVVVTEDLALLSPDRLRDFDVLFFFTSGELPLSDEQKSGLLAFVRNGKGFGGVHSATDTLYTWPEYGDLIGAYFDGHPWAQEVAIDVEDPDHPAVRHLAPSFRIADEIYQFRSFSRDHVRVLMTLNAQTVDLSADGVDRTDGDFALAWCRQYGEGRVFYTALGHPESTWTDPRYQAMLAGALLWLSRQADGDAAPRGGSSPPAPEFSKAGVVNALNYSADRLAPGAYLSIFGRDLTSGSTLQAAQGTAPWKLAGTSVTVNGSPIPLLYVSPGQINAQLPGALAAPQSATIAVTSGLRTSLGVTIEITSPAAGSSIEFR